MPAGKQKTKKSIAKRFKFSGSGKMMRQKAAHNHRLNPKSKKAKGLAKMNHEVSKGEVKNLKRGVLV